MVATMIGEQMERLGLASTDLRRIWLHQANANMNRLIASKVLGHEGQRPTKAQPYSTPMPTPRPQAQSSHFISTATIWGGRRHRPDLFVRRRLFGRHGVRAQGGMRSEEETKPPLTGNT